jgi:hypothetical protein
VTPADDGVDPGVPLVDLRSIPDLPDPTFATIEPAWPPASCPVCGGALTEIVTFESAEPVRVICDDPRCGWSQSRSAAVAIDVNEVPDPEVTS